MKALSILLFAILIGNVGFGQEDTTSTKQMYIVTKNDGKEYFCEIISDDGREVLIMTEELGKIYIPKSEIASIKKIEASELGESYSNEYRSIGPFTTRYIFTTNALPIKKGEDYAMIHLYGPEVHFAVSDNFNIGIMSTWIASPFVVAAKYSFESDREDLNFSIGTLIGTSGYLNQFRGFGGLHFVNMTKGTREANFTLGAGFGYINPGFGNVVRTIPDEGTYIDEYEYFYEWNYPSTASSQRFFKAPVLSISGMAMVGSKATFIFDSMIAFSTNRSYSVNTTTISQPDYNSTPYIPGSYRHVVSHTKSMGVAAFIMPGMRFQSTPNRAFQFALAGVVGSRNGNYFAFPAPMLSWLFKF